MKYNKFSRRMFLQGSGALLSIPFLESLVPSEARAQTSEPIKRYLFYNVNFDVGHQRNWNPVLTSMPNSFAIPGSPHRGTYERLSAIRARKTQLSPIFGTAFDPFIDKMMFYKGLDIPSHGYHQNGQCYALGNMWSIGEGPLNPFSNPTPGRNPAIETFDRFIAKHPKFDPSRRPSINLRGHCTWEKNALGQVVPIGAIGNAYNAYDAYKAVFNGGNYPESGSQPIVHSRRDLLTRVLEDYNRLINGRKIGSSDKIILTNAMDSVADLQRGLTIEVGNACRHKDQDSRAQYNSNDPAHNDTISWSNYIKLITAIFQCDISRSVTIATGPNDFEDWTSKPVKDWHGNITHDHLGVYNNKPNWLAVSEYYGRHFTSLVAPMLAAMDSCIDPANNKSFLHNGLAHITAESHTPHRQLNLPNVTVGSLDGALPTGYMVDYHDRTRSVMGIAQGGTWSDDPVEMKDPNTDAFSYDYAGIPYQRFLVTLLQSMGFSPSDYEDPNLNRHLLNRTDGIYGTENNGITSVGGFGITSLERVDDLLADPDGAGYHHVRRMRRYNWHYYKFPLPLPPKV